MGVKRAALCDLEPTFRRGDLSVDADREDSESVQQKAFLLYKILGRCSISSLLFDYC